MLDAEYNTFMDIQQAINLRLMEEFARRGIEFAYPTTKQFTVNQDAAGGSRLKPLPLRNAAVCKPGPPVH